MLILLRLVWLRHFRVVAVHVSTEGMRNDTGFEDFFRHIEAVGSVSTSTLIPLSSASRTEGCRFLGVDETARMACEVRQDVARCQHLDDFRNDNVRVDLLIEIVRQRPELTKMDVIAGPIASIYPCHFDHFEAPAGNRNFRVRLDAFGKVAVRVDDANGGGHVDAIRAVELGVIMAFQTTDDISGNESDDVGVCRSTM